MTRTVSGGLACKKTKPLIPKIIFLNNWWNDQQQPRMNRKTSTETVSHKCLPNCLLSLRLPHFRFLVSFCQNIAERSAGDGTLELDRPPRAFLLHLLLHSLLVFAPIQNRPMHLARVALRVVQLCTFGIYKVESLTQQTVQRCNKWYSHLLCLSYTITQVTFRLILLGNTFTDSNFYSALLYLQCSQFGLNLMTCKWTQLVCLDLRALHSVGGNALCDFDRRQRHAD